MGRGPTISVFTSGLALPCAVGLWLVLLLALFLWPILTNSPTLGMDLIQYTVRLSLLYYAAALNLMLWLRPTDWHDQGPTMRLARCCWSLGWLTFLVHLAMAFHFFHGWSHADAVRHTREVSGVGAGIYVSHLFTLVWTADVALWWFRPGTYAARPLWVGTLLHGFMLFIVFNGTIVYEQGTIRWLGVLMFAELVIAKQLADFGWLFCLRK